MRKYIFRRVVQSIICVLAISVAIFLLVRVVGDPVVLLSGQEGIASAQQYEALRQELGLDRPLPLQYGAFLRDVFKGEFGRSFRYNRPSLSLVLSRMPATLQLTAAAMLLATLVGVPLGVITAVRVNGLADRFGKVFALLGQSMPTFWVGIMLIFVFAVKFHVLPTSGRDGVSHLVLPAFSLGWYSMAALTRLTRSAMLDVLDSEYIKMARIKGLSEWIVVGKHAFKNACIPVITLFATQFIALLGGTVIIETVFAWPGLGRLAVESIFSRDYPVVQTVVFLLSCLFVGANLMVDISYAYLDPRIRYG